MESAAESDRSIADAEYSLAKAGGHEVEFNRVNCLVWVLYESARSFSLAIQTIELAKTGPPLAMAWNGVDVNAWHKHVAYQVCTHFGIIVCVDIYKYTFMCVKREWNL